MPRLDRLDDTMLRGAQLVMQIMAKKMELNANLDRERKRAGSAIAKDSIGSGGNSMGGNTQIHFQQFSHNAVGCFLLCFLSTNTIWYFFPKTNVKILVLFLIVYILLHIVQIPAILPYLFLSVCCGLLFISGKILRFIKCTYQFENCCQYLQLFSCYRKKQKNQRNVTIGLLIWLMASLWQC